MVGTEINSEICISCRLKHALQVFNMAGLLLFVFWFDVGHLDLMVIAFVSVKQIQKI